MRKRLSKPDLREWFKSIAAGKNPAAVELGKLGGARGGAMTARRRTKKQRSDAARKAARARWRKRRETEAQRKKRRDAMNRARNTFFRFVNAEFLKYSRKYPYLRKIRPTLAELDIFYMAHFQKTGRRWSPRQLLTRYDHALKSEARRKKTC